MQLFPRNDVVGPAVVCESRQFPNSVSHFIHFLPFGGLPAAVLPCILTALVLAPCGCSNSESFEQDNAKAMAASLEKIKSQSPHSVIVTSLIAKLKEGSTAPAFRVSLGSISPQDVQVEFATAGSASPQDLVMLEASSMVVIPAGQTFVDVAIQVRDDYLVELEETLQISLESCDGEYEIDDSIVSLVRLIDNDEPTDTRINFANLVPSGSKGSDDEGVEIESSVVCSGFRFQDDGPGQQRSLVIVGGDDEVSGQMLRSLDYMRNLIVLREDNQAFSINSFDYAATASEPWAVFDATVTGHFVDGSTETREISSESRIAKTLTLNWHELDRIIIDFREGAAGHRFGLVGNFLFNNRDQAFAKNERQHGTGEPANSTATVTVSSKGSDARL